MNARKWSLALSVLVSTPIALATGAAGAMAQVVQEPLSATLVDSLSLEVSALRTEVQRLSEVTGLLEATTLGAAQATATGAAPEAQAPGALTQAAAQDEPSAPTAALDEAAQSVERLGIRSFWAVVVLLMTFFVVRTLSWFLTRLAERNARRRLLLMRLEPIIRTVVWAVSIGVVLRVVFNVDAATLLAAGAALGVAIGFAAQDILKNIFGGLVILVDGPFQVGDKISVAGTYGEVSAIGSRSTRIVTPDDNLVSVPNSQIVGQQVSNANAGALDCQVVTDLYLPGWVDVGLAKDIAYRAAITSRYVYRKKPVVVLVKDEIHDTFVTHLKVKAYVLDIRFEFAFMSDVTERARAAFREAGLLPPWHGVKPYLLMNSEGRVAQQGAPAVDSAPA